MVHIRKSQHARANITNSRSVRACSCTMQLYECIICICRGNARWRSKTRLDKADSACLGYFVLKRVPELKSQLWWAQMSHVNPVRNLPHTQTYKPQVLIYCTRVVTNSINYPQESFVTIYDINKPQINLLLRIKCLQFLYNNYHALKWYVMRATKYEHLIGISSSWHTHH